MCENPYVSTSQADSAVSTSQSDAQLLIMPPSDPAASILNPPTGRIQGV